MADDRLLAEWKYETTTSAANFNLTSYSACWTKDG